MRQFPARPRIVTSISVTTAVAAWCLAAAAAEIRRDMVVYGATSGGITAAIQARAMGKSVIVVEPGRHLGGLSAGGLGATDVGNKAAIRGPIASSTSRLLSFSTGSPISCRRRASTGTGITGCLHRITSSGGP